jgi:hypothetical protein
MLTAHVRWLRGIERVLVELRQLPSSWLDRSAADTDPLVASDVEGET